MANAPAGYSDTPEGYSSTPSNAPAGYSDTPDGFSDSHSPISADVIPSHVPFAAPEKTFGQRLADNLALVGSGPTGWAQRLMATHAPAKAAAAVGEAKDFAKGAYTDLSNSPSPLSDVALGVTSGAASMTNKAIGGGMKFIGSQTNSPNLSAAGDQVSKGLAWDNPSDVDSDKAQLAQFENTNLGKLTTTAGDAIPMLGIGGVNGVAKGVLEDVGANLTSLGARAGFRAFQGASLAAPTSLDTYYNVKDAYQNQLVAQGVDPKVAEQAATTKAATDTAKAFAGQTAMGGFLFSSRVAEAFDAGANSAPAVIWNRLVKAGAFGTGQEAMDSMLNGQDFKLSGAFGKAVVFAAYEAHGAISKIKAGFDAPVAPEAPTAPSPDAPAPEPSAPGEPQPEPSPAPAPSAEDASARPGASGRGNSFDEAAARAKTMRQYYDSIMGKASTRSEAVQAREFFRRTVGKKLNGHFDELFPEIPTDWQPTSQPSTESPSTPQDAPNAQTAPDVPTGHTEAPGEAEPSVTHMTMNIRGEGSTELTDPHLIDALIQATEEHTGRVEALKKLSMTSTDRAEAIKASGEQLLAVKRMLREKANGIQERGPEAVGEISGGTGDAGAGPGDAGEPGQPGAIVAGSDQPAQGSPAPVEAKAGENAPVNVQNNPILSDGDTNGNANESGSGSWREADGVGGTPSDDHQPTLQGSARDASPTEQLSKRRGEALSRFASGEVEPKTLPNHASLPANADPDRLLTLSTGSGKGEVLAPADKGTLPSGNTYQTYTHNEVQLSLPDNGGILHMSVHPSKGLVGLDTIHVNEDQRGLGKAKGLFQDAAKLLQAAYPEIRMATAELTTPEAHDLIGSYPNAVIKGNTALIPIADLASRASRPHNTGWHGSATDHDGFDSTYINTGEGAQAYSWGHYFGGPRKTGEWYRDKLTQGNEYAFSKGGEKLSYLEALEKYFTPGKLVPGYGGWDKVIEFHNDEAKRHAGAWHVDVIGVNKDGTERPYERPRSHATMPGSEELKSALEAKGYKGNKGGVLYKVHIPDDSRMILWDKKMSEQTPEVLKALRSLGLTGNGDTPENISGKGAYYRAMKSFGEVSPDNPKGDREASHAMSDAGITGVKFEDGNSQGRSNLEVVKSTSNDPNRAWCVREGMHGLPEGFFPTVDAANEYIKSELARITHNYVVFKDSDIKITKKFYGDMFGGQQAYEEFMKRNGLDPDMSASDFAKMAWDKIKGLGKTIKETILKLMQAFKGLPRIAAEKLAKHLNNVADQWEERARKSAQETPGEAGTAGEGKSAKDEEEGSTEAPPKRNLNKMGQRSEDIISQEAAHVHLGDAQRRFITKESKAAIDKLNVADQHKLYDLIESPVDNISRAALPEGLKKDLLHMREDNERRYKLMDELGIAPDYIENYFAHLWQRPSAAKSAFSSYAHSPFEGTKSATKKRTIPTIREGMELGLKPLFDNPFDMWYASSIDQDKYIYANQAWQKFEKEGLILNLKNGQPVPEGWERMKDAISNGMSRGKATTAYAPSSVADPFNNYLSPGFTGKARTGYEYFRQVSAGMLQSTLSLSGFHALYISNESSIMDMSRAIQNVVQDGDFSSAARNNANALIPGLGQSNNYQLGHQIQESLLSGEAPKFTDFTLSASANLAGMSSPELQKLLARGGMRAVNDSDYSNRLVQSISTSFRKAFDPTIPGVDRAKAVPKDVYNAALRIMQLTSHPLMEMYVPRIKLGCYFKLVTDEMARAQAGGRVLTEAQKDRICRRCGDLVEDRMGQLAYDNLHINKITKQLAQTIFRSTGWNVGNLRNYFNVARDTAGLAVQGAKSVATAAGAGGVPPKSTEENLDEGKAGRAAGFTNRISGEIASYVMLGVISSITMMLATGKHPTSTKDLIAPQVGGHGKNGHPNRVMVPSMAKDEQETTAAITDLAKGNPNTAFNYAKGKVGPLPSLMADTLQNRDWKGDEVYDPQASVGTRLGQLASHAASGYAPIGLSKASQDAREGQGVRSILPVLGILPAPSKIANSKAENLALELASHASSHVLSPEQSAGQDKKKEAAEAYAAGDRKPLLAMQKNGEITGKQFQALNNAHRNLDILTFATKRIEAGDAMRVFKVADHDEQKKLVPIIQSKFGKYLSTIPIKDRQQAIKNWNAMKQEAFKK